ncbi:MAG TPA: hypothetical protein PLS53_07715 [Thermoanaerobaculaceae bacterium]|nr:hypothetical protein [Thermoanaerobaculaceae bacterium]HPS78024.1 hypothetical protein [Thermoanaerobaculaceae bacterium]
MRASILTVVLLGIAAGLAAISSEPVYIKGYEGASGVVSAVEAIKTARKSIKLDPANQQILANLEPVIAKLGDKAKMYKDKPVEVTPEYAGLTAAVRKIKLAREHVLLQKLDALVKAIELANK